MSERHDMEMEERGSGLVVPAERPPAPVPAKTYCPLELEGKEARAVAKEALETLWKVSGLYDNSMYEDRSMLKAREGAWWLLAKMLLGDGDDFPDCEQLT